MFFLQQPCAMVDTRLPRLGVLGGRQTQCSGVSKSNRWAQPLETRQAHETRGPRLQTRLASCQTNCSKPSRTRELTQLAAQVAAQAAAGEASVASWVAAGDSAWESCPETVGLAVSQLDQHLSA